MAPMRGSGGIAHSFIVAEHAAEAFRSGAVLVCPQYLRSSELSAARFGAAALSGRFGASAALAGTSTTVDVEVRSCAMLDLVSDRVWPALPSSLLGVVQAIEDLREHLAISTKRLLCEEMELQLLNYAEGGLYVKHIDDGLGTADRPVRRSVSLLLYLTPDHWQDGYGGQLRIHPAASGAIARVQQLSLDNEGNGVEDIASGEPIDIIPVPGTLVLFDSATVPHEVLVTRRPRSAIVGWMLEQRRFGESIERVALADRAWIHT